MLPKEAEVVVVGGGPTGLVLTSMLRQAGHDVLALDRQAEGANNSRAAAIHAKTLKVLRELNVTDRLVAEGSSCRRPRFAIATGSVSQERLKLLASWAQPTPVNGRTRRCTTR